jgi:hypothetical protein
MAALRFGEVELRDHAPGLGGVVCSDRRFEPLAQRLRLAELAAEPAQQADVRCAI